MGKDKDPAPPEDADAAIPAQQPAGPTPLELAQGPLDLLADRERQLEALRGALTMTCWAGVCAALPEAATWFDNRGRLL